MPEQLAHVASVLRSMTGLSVAGAGRATSAGGATDFSGKGQYLPKATMCDGDHFAAFLPSVFRV